MSKTTAQKAHAEAEPKPAQGHKPLTDPSGEHLEPLEPLVLREDEPVRGFNHDSLALRRTVDVIAGAAVGTTGPFTIGVTGRWGTGKTSALRLAKARIEHHAESQPADGSSPHIVTVFFNAWQYEREEYPIVPLVASIVSAIDRKRLDLQRSSPGERVKSAGKDTLRDLSRALRAIAYGFSAKTTVGVPGVGGVEAAFVADKIIDRFDEFDKPADPLLDRSLYYEAFESLEKATRPAGAEPEVKVIVFIDDLDRCAPDLALPLIEKIKLVLAQPGFVFVLGVDRRVLTRYINDRYKQYDIDGEEYLEKIIQLSLPLPSHEPHFEEFVEHIITQCGEQLSIEIMPDFVELLSTATDHNPRGLVRLINNLVVDLPLGKHLLENTELFQEETDAERTRAFLGLCVVTRVVQYRLDAQDFQQLVNSPAMLDSLAGGSSDPEETAMHRPDLAEALEVSRRHLQNVHELDESQQSVMHQRLVDVIKNKPQIVGVLKTDDGHRWLTDHRLRRAVLTFFAETREERSAEVEPEQQEIIDDAIRLSLDLEPDAPITEVERHRVKVLNLIGTSVTDSGLTLLSGLCNLSALCLNKTGVSDLSPLSGLSNLSELNLNGTGVSDLSPLHGLERLSRIFLRRTPVTKEEVRRLQDAIPTLKVRP
ncbi:MAG: P-loop NTPase fold protein [Planctomycetota bacterium]